MNDARYPHQEMTREIIAAAYEVHRELGWGFLEKVYENALALELRIRNLTASQQAEIEIQYKGNIAGVYYADLLVNDTVLCELSRSRLSTMRIKPSC